MKIVQSFENYLDCETQCNNKSDPSHHHLVNYKEEIITYDPNETNFDRIRIPKIVDYAWAILDRGCDWSKDYGRCNRVQMGFDEGIPFILKKTIIKIDMKFKKQRNHVLCGFSKEKKKFILSNEVRVTVRPTAQGFLI